MKKCIVCLLTLVMLVSMTACNPPWEPIQAEKPVIYLYPTTDTLVSVKLDYNGALTATYPAYHDGWTVQASPDGTLTDPVTGRTYYCLYWEGIDDVEYDLSKGFVIPGADTAAFLEDALAKLGLTEREANEFIIYWLPRMDKKYRNENYILIFLL